MAYYDFLNVVFSPLLKLPVFWSIFLLSFLISLIIIIITKYTTDQALMKRLKEELQGYQKQIKENRSNPAKAIEIQKKAMESNMKYMMHSLRPTLITFIPIILIFGWMSATFAYESIKPQQEFTVTALFDKNANGNANLGIAEGLEIIGSKTKNIEDGKATWNLKGNEGEHIIEVDYNVEKQQTSVLVTNDRKYINPLKKTEGSIKSIQINYKKLVVLPIGFRDWFGWLGTYIMFSIAFTMGLRKLMKVY